MHKQKLRELKRINATPKMIELAKNNGKVMKYEYRYGKTPLVCNTEYDLMIRCQSRGKILMICIFLPEDIQKGNTSPRFEIYCNPEGDEYITREMHGTKEKGWTKAMVKNLPELYHKPSIGESWYYKGIEKRIWMNKDTKSTIKSMLKTDKNGIDGIMEWQRRTRENNRIAAEKRQQAPWDEDMALVPDVCPSFKKWMQKECARNYFIFYKYDKKGATEGYCSHCMQTVPISKPKHNKKTKCKHCGVSASFKADTKIQRLKTGVYFGCIVQKIKGGIVIRTYQGQNEYTNRSVDNPHVYISEVSRNLLFDEGTIKNYEWSLYKNKKMRWVPFEGRYYVYDTAKLYRKNIKQLKKSTVLKHSTIDYWKELPCDCARYIKAERSNKCIEKLVKIGMFELANDMIHGKCYTLLNMEATELAKMLKLDKQRLQRLKNMNGGATHLEWLQYEKIANRQWKDEMIRDFGKAEFITSEFDFLPVPVSFEKIWNYIKKQSAIMEDVMYEVVVHTWEDYINMAEKAGLNIKSDMIWKPKDLYEAHQEVILLLQNGEMEKQAAELAKKWTKVNDILPKLSKFEYSNDNYAIVTPRAIIDIVKEGTSLRHCVHTCDFYFDRIEKNESYLFFLRRAERINSSWYTLEVEPSGNIRQKRTTGDNQDKDLDEAIVFLRKWQQFFKTKMTEEEKELGIKADEARKQEYAKLRRDGNKVWHGKLAGKLLADVLEDDFLAAI